MPTYTIDSAHAKSFSDAITEHHFGANYVYNYERFGDESWEKYDELIEEIGLTNIRYPGGNAIETNFDITNPNSTTNLWGQSVTPMDEFIEFIGSHGLDATLIMPTRPFLPGESHELITYNSGTGNWEIDPDKLADVKADIVAFVREIMTTAAEHNANIYAIEIGNEYPGVSYTTSAGEASKMNAKQYGTIANELAKIAQETIDEFNASASSGQQDPQLVAQIWGDYNQDGHGTDSLDAFNENVLAQFDADGLAAIDTVSHHVYFKELKTSADGEVHSYDTLAKMLGDMIAMSDIWDEAAGRDLDIMVSEWNIQKFGFHDPGFDYWDENSTWNVSQEWIETTNYGLKQVAPMLEMFSSFLKHKVDSAHIWSVMYSATALGTHLNNGQLFAGGGLMQLLQQELIGASYIEMGYQSENHDIHVFEGENTGHVFVSSLREAPQSIALNLSEYGGDLESVSIKFLRADKANADGQFTINGMTYILPDADHAYLEADLSLMIEEGTALVENGVLWVDLGAFETAYISFETEGKLSDKIGIEGTTYGGDNTFNGGSNNDKLKGTAENDTVNGFEGDDFLDGREGNDFLKGGAGNDTIYGSGGSDKLIGGIGSDDIHGGTGYFDGFVDFDATTAGFSNNIDPGLLSLFGEFSYLVGASITGEQEADDTNGIDQNDFLDGGEGNDFLNGSNGNDYLDGGEGDDILTGGADYDTFVFDGNFGHDTITDYDGNQDQIEIFASEEIASGELLTTYAKQEADDVVITLDDYRSVTIKDTTIAELEDANVMII
jgi:Ca2+-binding RTX toxin-like protein